MKSRDLGSYEGHITHEWGLDADVDVPMFDRGRGAWALVLAALKALGPVVDMSQGRAGTVYASKDAYGEPCILIKDIPARARPSFENWIAGQTIPVRGISPASSSSATRTATSRWYASTGLRPTPSCPWVT